MSNKVTGQFSVSCDTLSVQHRIALSVSFLQNYFHLKNYGVNGMENSGNVMLLIYAWQEK